MMCLIMRWRIGTTRIKITIAIMNLNAPKKISLALFKKLCNLESRATVNNLLSAQRTLETALEKVITKNLTIKRQPTVPLGILCRLGAPIANRPARSTGAWPLRPQSHCQCIPVAALLGPTTTPTPTIKRTQETKRVGAHQTSSLDFYSPRAPQQLA